MKSKLGIFILLVIQFYTASSAPPKRPILLFNVEEELDKIGDACYNKTDYIEMTGKIVVGSIAEKIAEVSMKEGLTTIALTELRATLKYGPLRPWTHHKEKDPSKEELAAAKTLEQYYDLVEPRSKDRSLDSNSLFETNLIPTIAYFDKRFPSIRIICRRKFERTKRSLKTLDRKGIDKLIKDFHEVWGQINDRLQKRTWKWNC